MSHELTFQEEEYSRQLDFALWRRILRHAGRYWKQLLALSGAGLTVATVDVMLPLVTAWIIDEAMASGVTPRLWTYVVLYFGLCALLCSCIWLFIELAGQTSTGIAYDLRRKGFRRLQELSFSYFDVRPVGWLVTRLTSDVTKLSSLMPWFTLDLVWGSFLVLGITGAMFWLNWQLALAVLVIVPPLSIASVYFQKRLLASSRNMRRTNSMITASFSESISGVRTTKALVREEENLNEFRSLSTAMHQHCLRNALQSAVYLPIVVTLGSLGVGLALWRGGVDVLGPDSTLTLGVLIAFMQYAALFHMPIEELARRFTDLQAAQAAAERIQTLLDTEPEIQDSAEVRSRMAATAPHQAAGASNLAEDGCADTVRRIEFRNVSFWYKPDEPVLRSFNLTVEPGETIALVGATGGGKSTIVSLLARFYEPQEGEILIDDTDYRERSLHWWQSNLGIVLQSPVLFTGTIRENIRYGRLDASDAEIEAAARLVNAETFIRELDGGYEFDVGEMGSRLSTGQRQLMSLARAVLADPRVFILDEATSSVDTETEQLIQDGINKVLSGRISFVIAHRLSTIRAASRILVIDGGEVVEQGSHDELIRERGRYHDLYVGQFARQREAERLSGGEETGMAGA